MITHHATTSKKSLSPSGIAIVLQCLLATALIFGGFLSSPPLAADQFLMAAPIEQEDVTPKDIEELRAIEKEFRQVAAKVVKSVVGIQIGPSRGSGVIISSDGLILTAGHVAKKPGSKAIITTSDGKTYKGVSLGIYASADAGMMKITDKGKWPHVEMADSDSFKVGQWCLALGHPLGYQKGRPPVVRMGRILQVEERTIQTDCPLIVGDSGGPLFNLDGKVIGINSRISGPLSMNYHVSIDIFHEYWDRLKKGHAWFDKTMRDTKTVKAAFRKIVAKTARCVVQIRCNKKDTVLGTIVGPDGWILTKASELKGRIIVRLPDGRDLEARIIGISSKFDLAMLKIDAVDLPKISWQLKDPDVGQWVAVPGMGKDPLTIGVISVPRRAIPLIKGSLGVFLKETKEGVTVTLVLPKSPAAKAGLKKGDVITHLNGKLVKSQESLTNSMKLIRAGTEVKLGIRRGKDTFQKTVTLGKLVTAATKKRDSLNSTGVGVSRRHDGFPVVLQYDGILRPSDCGSPLVTLDGKAVGVNIARGGRTETYCVPANALIVLMYDLMSGRLRPESSEADETPSEEKKPKAEPAKPEATPKAKPEKPEPKPKDKKASGDKKVLKDKKAPREQKQPETKKSKLKIEQPKPKAKDKAAANPETKQPKAVPKLKKKHQLYKQALEKLKKSRAKLNKPSKLTPEKKAIPKKPLKPTVEKKSRPEVKQPSKEEPKAKPSEPKKSKSAPKSKMPKELPVSKAESKAEKQLKKGKKAKRSPSAEKTEQPSVKQEKFPKEETKKLESPKQEPGEKSSEKTDKKQDPQKEEAQVKQPTPPQEEVKESK